MNTKNLHLLILGLLFTISLTAQDCDCYAKDSYTYVEHKGRYITVRIPVECDSLFSMEQINAFLNLEDIYYEVCQDFFGWPFLHPKSLETTISPSFAGAGTGIGGTGYGFGYFGKNLSGFDRDMFASEIDFYSTLIHEGIHRWDFRGQGYWQGPDFAHPFTVGLQDYMAYKMGMSHVGLYQESTSSLTTDLEIKRRYKYFWRRYLSHPELNWEYYFKTGLSNEYIFGQAPKPEAYERLAIQGATLLSVIFMHGEPAVQSIFAALEKMRTEDPTWDSDMTKYTVLNRHIRAFGDGLQLDVSDYFDYWKYPVSDNMRTYLSQYPKSDKILDQDQDGFSPLQGDFVDNDKTIYPDAPELADGLDNNLDGQIDELVISEKSGDLPNGGDGPEGTLPLLVQGGLADLNDSDAFYFTLTERSLVTFIFTSLNSDTIIQFPEYSMAIFNGILQRNGSYLLKQDVYSGENNIHRTEYLDPGTYKMNVVGQGDNYLVPGEYEIQIFVNQQNPTVFEKNGYTYTHKVYNNLPADPNFNVNTVRGVSPQEATVLKELYLNHGGPNWKDSRGWLASEDVCYWRGMHCDRTGLSKLALDYQRPLDKAFTTDQVLALSNLRELNITGSNFQEQAFPDAFDAWRNVSMINLEYNNIKGPLPATLAGKRKLWFLNLAGNKFTGAIPDTWSDLPNLTFLNVAGNQLSGALPKDLYRLTKLKEFYFDTYNSCVPNQEVWDWLEKIPQKSPGYTRCHQPPTDFSVVAPINKSYDLTQTGTNSVNFDWTDSQDPEGGPIAYTWVLGSWASFNGVTSFGNILEIPVSGASNLELSYQALADSLATRGFSSAISGFYHFTIATDGDWRTSTDTVAIQLQLAPGNCKLTGSLAITPPNCADPNSGSATVNLRNSFGLKGYAWSSGQTAATVAKLSAGPYTVTVTDQTGCTTEIHGFLPLTPIAARIDPTPQGFQASASGGTSPYAYAWNNKTTGDKFTGSSNDTYSLMVIDALGCQQLFLSPPILQNAGGISTYQFVATWKSVPGALGYTVQVALDAAFTKILPTYTNFRVEGQSWASIANLNPEVTYYYRAAAWNNESVSEYSSSQTIKLGESPCSLYVVPTVTHIMQNTVAQGSIQATAWGGNGTYSYKWNDGATTSSRNNLNKGSYSLTVTDSNGCTGSIAAEILAVERNAFGNRVWLDKNRNGIQEDGEPGIPNVYVYVWEDQDGDGDAETSRGVVTTDANGIYRFPNLGPGIYKAFVWEVNNFDPGGALFGMANSPGSLDPDNDFPLDDNGEPGGIGNNTPFGSVTSKSFTLTAGGEPRNDGDLTAGTFNPDPSGNMTIDFGFFRKNECPDMTARFSGDLLVCDTSATGSIQAQAINAIGPVRYEWSEANQTNTLNDVGIGQYTLRITDAVGCQQTVTASVITLADLELQTTITPASTESPASGAIVISNNLGNVSYAWSNGSTTKDLTGVVAGEYQLTVTAANGCTKSFSFTIGTVTALPTIYAELGLQLFPNPSRSFIQLAKAAGQTVPLPLDGAVVGIDGRTLFQFSGRSLDQVNALLRTQTAALPAGSYYLQLQTGKQRGSQPFVLIR